MRILMVTEDLPAPSMGGLARHVLVLCRALTKAGHVVDLMGNDDFPATDLEDKRQFDGRFFPELHGQFDGWKEMTAGVFMPGKRSLLARRFARAIQRRAGEYDVIHYHGHLPNVAYYLPSAINFLQTRHDQGSDCLTHTRFRQGEICVATAPEACAACRTWHPNWLQRHISAWAVRRFRHEVQTGFARHKTVFVSDMLRRNLSRSLGKQHWGVTIHNFVDVAQAQAIRQVIKARRSGERLHVFIAAKLYSAKGVSALLAHLEPYLGHSLVLDIAGDGEEEARLRSQYPQVTFHGWQNIDATLRLAAQAQAIAVPSLCEEACSSTVLEGLLLGKTVFALRRGGTPELAVYASWPDQLRLYDSLQELSQGLLNFTATPKDPAAPSLAADVGHAADRLLALYALPPGSLAY